MGILKDVEFRRDGVSARSVLVLPSDFQSKSPCFYDSSHD